MLEKEIDPLSKSNEGMMLSRYQRAQSLMQGIFTKDTALNSTVFPLWIGDSDCFWYERESKKGKEYRLVDAKAKTNTTAFDHAVLAATLSEAATQEVDANNLSIKDVKMQLSTTANTVKLVCFNAFDKHWQFDVITSTCTIVETPSAEWVISPNGKHAIVARDFNLWLHDMDGGEERALTQDGEEYYVYGATGAAWGYLHESALQVRWPLASIIGRRIACKQ